MNDERTILELIKDLQSDDYDIKYNAASSLILTKTNEIAEMGQESVDVLVKALEDESVQVRYSTVVVLGKIGGPEAIKGLVKALDDDNGQVRKLVVGILGRIGNTEGIGIIWKTILEYAAEESEKGTVRKKRVTERMAGAMKAIMQKVRERKGKVDQGRLSDGKPQPPKGHGKQMLRTLRVTSG